MDRGLEKPPESRLGRLLGRFAVLAEAIETHPDELLERRVAELERRLDASGAQGGRPSQAPSLTARSI